MADVANITTNITDGIAIGADTTDGVTINTSVTEGTTIAAQIVSGAKGDKGDIGLQGPQGTQGIQGLIGPTGDTGPQGIQGVKGDTGATGATGSTGPQGVKGDTGLTGSTGLKGDKGDTGTAATIAIGTVTTGAAGSSATVSNAGTTGAAVFNFSIPKGADGTGVGDMMAANNLSDLANASTARTNLGVAIGSNVQAYSSILAGTTASYTTAADTKLSGVETGAQVNTVTSVAGKTGAVTLGVTNIATTSGTASSATYLRGDNTWNTPTNTTYTAMAVSEGQTGTATTSRVVRADYLKTIILYHANAALQAQGRPPFWL